MAFLNPAAASIMQLRLKEIDGRLIETPSGKDSAVNSTVKSAALSELASLVGGRVIGDETTPIHDAATIRDAKPGDITFANDETRVAALAECAATAAIIHPDATPPDLPVIVVADVTEAFIQIVTHFRPPRVAAPAGVSPHAVVHASTKVGKNVCIYPGAFVDEGVTIGDGCVIHSGARILSGCIIGCDVQVFPNAVVYEHCEIGDRVILHAGAVIGSYGFGYSTIDGEHRLSAQLGNTVLEEDVHIGANSTVDRGTYGETRIGCGTKIDNQVQIAHNCRIGRHNLICSFVGIAGSTTTGDYVVLAGQVGIRDHVKLGDGVVVGAQAGIMNNVPDGAKLLGSPAMPEREQMLVFASMIKLPQLRKDFRKLQRAVAALTPSDVSNEAQDAA